MKPGHVRRLVIIAVVGRRGSHPSPASAETGVIGSYLLADWAHGYRRPSPGGHA